MSQRKLVCLVPSNYAALHLRRMERHIVERDLDGFFDHVYTIHYPAAQYQVINLSERHTIMEFPFLLRPLRRSVLKPLGFLAAEMFLLFSLMRLIRREGISAIKAHDPYLQGFNAHILSRLCGVPYVVGIFCNYDMIYEGTGRYDYASLLRSHRLLKMLERFVLRRAPMVWGGNGNNLQFAIDNGTPPERAYVSRVIGVNPMFFEGLPDLNGLRQHFGIKNEKIVIFVSRLSPEKYPEDVVACAEKVCAERSDVVFWFMGDGPQREEITHLVRLKGLEHRLILWGFCTQAELKQRLLAADLVISPLTGSALVEAALCAKPIVAYDAEWQSELIRDNEEGYLVPFRDVGALSEKTLALLNDDDERQRMGQRARERAFHQHHPDVVFAKERALFEKLLTGRR